MRPLPPPPMSLARAAVEAACVASACALVGLVVNLVHPNAIPLVARHPYEILVPCPEPGGEVTGLDPSAASVGAASSFLVDARPAEQAALWSIGGATNITFDYLDPTPTATLEALARDITRSRAHRVVVFGDGDSPDSGEQLAREISGHGIRNVCFVIGGAPALHRVREGSARP